MHVRRWSIPIALAAAAGRPAAAQPDYEADATVNVGYDQITRSTFQADPMAEPGDVPDETSNRLFTELRPSIAVQTGSPRLAWRFGYLFSSSINLRDVNPTYSNQGNATLVAQPTRYVMLTLNASAAQGGSSLLTSQRPAETAQPEIRAPGNPSTVSATAAESLTWDAGRRLALQQSLGVTTSAPQDSLDQYNGTVNGSLALERLFRRYTAGLEARSAVSRLRPLQSTLAPYTSVTNAALIRFNHDFSYKWNGLATAGVEQVYTTTGSEPVALLPTGSLTALYTSGNIGGAVELGHGAVTNIQVGTVSLTDKVTARGVLLLDVRKLRTVSFSVGFLHNEPIGESAAIVAAGTGNVAQADAGFSTALTRSRNLLGTARYSLSYQYAQGGGLSPVLAHIILVGVTGHYSNTSKVIQPLPARGRRVDGSDAKGFPLGGDAIEGGDDRDASSPQQPQQPRQ